MSSTIPVIIEFFEFGMLAFSTYVLLRVNSSKKLRYQRVPISQAPCKGKH